jgi:hypothetical protein
MGNSSLYVRPTCPHDEVPRNGSAVFRGVPERSTTASVASIPHQGRVRPAASVPRIRRQGCKKGQDGGPCHLNLKGCKSEKAEHCAH